jgi:hypothetical protein
MLEAIVVLAMNNATSSVGEVVGKGISRQDAKPLRRQADDALMSAKGVDSPRSLLPFVPWRLCGLARKPVCKRLSTAQRPVANRLQYLCPSPLKFHLILPRETRRS